MSGQPTSTYRWASVGGHLALDLCNTMSWRLDDARRVDRLSTPSDLVDWFCTLTGSPAREALTQQVRAEPEVAGKALRAVRQLRDATIRVVDAHVAQVPAAAEDVDRIATAWRRALAVATTRAELPWRWSVETATPGDVTHALALSVADLLHRPDQSRLRRCDGDGCGWLFLDSTRNRSRRWCDPLDCGNRARVRAYAERHRGPFPAAPDQSAAHLSRGTSRRRRP